MQRTSESGGMPQCTGLAPNLGDHSVYSGVITFMTPRTGDAAVEHQAPCAVIQQGLTGDPASKSVRLHATIVEDGVHIGNRGRFLPEVRVVDLRGAGSGL